MGRALVYVILQSLTFLLWILVFSAFIILLFLGLLILCKFILCLFYYIRWSRSHYWTFSANQGRDSKWEPEDMVLCESSSPRAIPRSALRSNTVPKSNRIRHIPIPKCMFPTQSAFSKWLLFPKCWSMVFGLKSYGLILLSPPFFPYIQVYVDILSINLYLFLSSIYSSTCLSLSSVRKWKLALIFPETPIDLLKLRYTVFLEFGHSHFGCFLFLFLHDLESLREAYFSLSFLKLLLCCLLCYFAEIYGQSNLCSFVLLVFPPQGLYECFLFL